MLGVEKNQLVFEERKLKVYPVAIKNPNGEECYSFICVPRKWKRTFLPKKAKAIEGLITKSYRDLTMGNNVTLPDGRVITPDDVCEPQVPS